MHRPDVNPGPGDLFTEGDPQLGQPPTTVTAAWLNDVGEGLCVLVEQSGQVLVKGGYGQIAQAVRTLGGGGGGAGNLLHNSDFAVWRRFAGTIAADGQRTSTTIAAGASRYEWDRWRVTNDLGAGNLVCWDNWATSGGVGQRVATINTFGNPSGQTYPKTVRLAQRVEYPEVLFGEVVTFSISVQRRPQVPTTCNFYGELTINLGTASGAGSPIVLTGADVSASAVSTTGLQLLSWTFTLPASVSGVKPRLTDDAYLEVALVWEFNADGIDALLTEINVGGAFFGVGGGSPIYRPRRPEVEVAACERFCRTSYPFDHKIGDATFLGAVRGQDAGTIAQSLCTRLNMRGSPTLTWFSPNDGASGNVYWNAANRAVTGTNHTSRESTGEPVIGASQGASSVYAHFLAEAEL